MLYELFGSPIGFEGFDQLAVAGLGLHQLGVRTVGDDLTAHEEHDLVGQRDRGGPAGHHHDGRLVERAVPSGGSAK